jgi:hypothetical protein
MTADERGKYEDVFAKADDDKDGFVSGTPARSGTLPWRPQLTPIPPMLYAGEQARTMFSRSQLPLPDLAKIWALADYGMDHRLDKEEFVIAMYFINARLKVQPCFTITHTHAHAHAHSLSHFPLNDSIMHRGDDCRMCSRKI